jgi:hypothetical protein
MLAALPAEIQALARIVPDVSSHSRSYPDSGPMIDMTVTGSRRTVHFERNLFNPSELRFPVVIGVPILPGNARAFAVGAKLRAC